MYYVAIQHVPTLELQVCPFTEEFPYFMWAHGNWSCDCNRELEFRETAGLDRWPDEEDTGYCKGDKEYKILWVQKEDGAIEYGDPKDW